MVRAWIDRGLALFLVFALVLGLAVAPVFAEGETDGQEPSGPSLEEQYILRTPRGIGSSGEPIFEIDSAERLAELATLVNAGDTRFNAAKYILTRDIDLSAYDNWTPIGSSAHPFAGSFDGDGYVVKNLKITGSESKYQGLFGVIDGGTVQNLGLVNCNITGGAGVGGLAGEMRSGSITGCFVTGSVSGQIGVGGLVGNLSCDVANAEISVTDCYSTAAVTADDGIAGGIAGHVFSSVTDTRVTIQRCYSTGIVSASGTGPCAGGVLGYVSSIAVDTLTVSNCVALNESVSASTGSANRILGDSTSSPSLTGNYAYLGGDSDTGNNGMNLTYDLDTGLSAQFSAIFTGADSEVWDIADNALPTLAVMKSAQDSALPSWMSSVTLISTAAELQDMSGSGNYALANDIDLAGVAWTPISVFTGTFDGRGYVIKNLTVSSAQHAGLFGDTSGATIKNLGIVDCDVSGSSTAGGVVGFLSGGGISNCFVTGRVSSSSSGGNVGGLVGHLSNATVSDCYSAATVSYSADYGNVGGVAGKMDNSAVVGCYSTGAVSTGTGGCAGGVVGNADGTNRVANCISMNAYVTTANFTGRICGSAMSSTLSNNYTIAGGGSATGNDGDNLTYNTDNGFSTALSEILGSAWDVPSAHALPTLKGFKSAQDSTLPLWVTTENVNFVRTAEELQAVGATGTYLLMNDIDLDGVTWTPIGSSSDAPFAGTFDGNGYVIRNLKITTSGGADNYKGLFGVIDGGTVKNLGLVDCNIAGWDSVGGLAGQMNSGSITGCFVTGSVSGRSAVGGLVGDLSPSYGNATTSVTDCYSTATVTASYGNAGGIAGLALFEFSGANISILRCYSTGTVSGGTSAGAGGVLGYIYFGPISEGTVNVSNCVALNASVSGGAGNANRILGGSDGNVSLTNNFGCGNMDSPTVNDGANLTYIAGIGLSPQLETVFQVTDMSLWDFVAGPLPTLKGFKSAQDSTLPLSVFDGTPVYDVDDLKAVANKLDGTYILMNDIDLDGEANWTPIGSSTVSPFAGTFDGNGYMIKNLTITDGQNSRGLFGVINGGTVKNLGLVNCDIKGHEGVGGLAGRMNSGSITGCFVTGSVSGNNKVGGLVGGLAPSYDTTISVTDCYSTATVTASYGEAGGIAGYVLVSAVNTLTSILRCYSTGTVTGGTHQEAGAGGVLGYVDFSTAGIVSVESCVALNASVSVSSGNANRILGGVYGSGSVNLAGNYALAATLVNGSRVSGGTKEGITNSGDLAEAMKGQALYVNSNWKLATFGNGADFTLTGYAAPWDKPTAATAVVRLPRLSRFAETQPYPTLPLSMLLYPNTVSIELDDIAAEVFTGSAITPKPVVKDFGNVLVEGEHYTLSYERNTNAGTDAATAYVTFTGIMSGVSQESKSFTIQKADAPAIADTSVSLAPGYMESCSLAALRTPFDAGTLSYTLDETYDHSIFHPAPSVVESSLNILIEENVAVGTTATVKVNIDSDNYNTMTATYNVTVAKRVAFPLSPVAAEPMAGETWEYELSDLAIPSNAGTLSYSVSATDDDDGILDGAPTVDGGKLSLKLKGDAQAGQTAAVTLTVTSANYEDATLTVNITVEETPAANGPSIPSTGGGIQRAVEGAKPGDSVIVKLPADGVIPGKVFETVKGKDITIHIQTGSGATWLVNGKDIPEGAELGDLNLSLNTRASSIPVDVINLITGVTTTMQLELVHDGPFGFALTLRLEVGAANRGYWANLYYFDPETEELSFRTSALIDGEGKADLLFDHASSYAVVIDYASHDNPFTDVDEGDWYADFVLGAYRRGLMQGMGGSLFVPGGTVTRAQVWTVLARLAEADVTGGNPWYAPALSWAVESGVSDGTMPETAISREQLVTMLWRHAGSPAAEAAAAGFADAQSVSDYAKTAMDWAISAGLIKGMEDGTLSPAGGATRAQLATVLQRYLALIAE